MTKQKIIQSAAYELNVLAATEIPIDVEQKIRKMSEDEDEPLPKYVLMKMVENYEIARNEQRPMCSDTGLPRYYVKVGNNATIEGGFVGLERILRKAVAQATHDIPLRPNRVHPLTRKDHNNNVGSHAPTVDYSFEPDVEWIEITAVHKGGLFGSDYRMLFPSDGTDGIRRFFLDVIGEFFRRGMSCQPVTIGIGLGGAKDTCVRLGKEAACLRVVGDRHPDSMIAQLEDDLLKLGNATGFSSMGFYGNQAVLDVHIETAYAHTGGMPMSVHHFCLAQRRKTVRIYPDGSTEYRDDPRWFTDYYRRETVD